MKRYITVNQEKAYRLVHHEFAGLSVSDAAMIMGVSRGTVYRWLSEMQAVAPQLFPCLSRQHAKLWRLWFDRGLTVRAVARLTGVSERCAAAELRIIKKIMKYKYISLSQREKTRSFNQLMDNEIENIQTIF